METEDIIARQKESKKPAVQRSLAKEYLCKWYVFILTVLTCYAGYSFEIVIYNFLLMAEISAFCSSLLAIFLGGLVSTLPFLVLNLALVFKKKKYLAIVFQIVAMEIIGMVFFVYSRLYI
jgi:hypothetical protein